ncbi:MAG: putative membrane protein, partial [Marinoscillum sp.]
MEMVYDLLKITIPGVLILYTSYLLVRSFLQKQLDEVHLNRRHRNQEIVTPIRLQAYERICLLLERISPNNLIPRLNGPEMSA